MAIYLKYLLFILFFLSGFCGLLYQVVWVRIAFASFGVITPVLSVVISVFMFGLFIGSWLAGRFVEKLTMTTRLSAIWFYAGAELLIGVGAFAVPHLFNLGEAVLLPVGAADSTYYLLWSALIITLSIFPWCMFMGMTFPLMMAYVREQSGHETTAFSFLYLANVIGAMAGTLITAIVLIELFGFSNTLFVAAGMNFFIAMISVFLGASRPLFLDVRSKLHVPAAFTFARGNRFVVMVLFMTGFTSIAMEVVWTRAFTVILHTQVYSFAMLLFVYLLATWIGSLFYRKHLFQKSAISTGQLCAWLAIASLLPIVMNDPRLQLNGAGALSSIFPFCALLGYLTPKLIDEYSGGSPQAAGIYYAVNIFGCILGPLVASYLMLPALGLKVSLLCLAAPYLILFFSGLTEQQTLMKRPEIYTIAALLLFSIVAARTYEDIGRSFGEGEKNLVLRDHTATVISFGSGMEKRLLVNGIGITYLTTITKVMAHLPLVFVNHKPTSALVICFGMGTTFRSLMSWGINVTAVELVPSVKKAFPYYFNDANEIMNRPNGKVIIDDGRRFLRRTLETFDVITIDPPPPVEAAGSSLLYSEEFYKTVKARLKPGGIMQQWIPQAEDSIVQAALKSLLNSFPYVKLYTSNEGWGHHFLASMSPIEVVSEDVLTERMPDAAKADLVEWVDDKNPAHLLTRVLGTEENASLYVRGSDARITDDRPYNEYYLLRRIINRLV